MSMNLRKRSNGGDVCCANCGSETHVSCTKKSAVAVRGEAMPVMTPDPDAFKTEFTPDEKYVVGGELNAFLLETILCTLRRAGRVAIAIEKECRVPSLLELAEQAKLAALNGRKLAGEHES